MINLENLFAAAERFQKERGTEREPSPEPRTVMAPTQLEKYRAGWAMDRLLSIIDQKDTARYADGADKLLIRAQIHLLRIPEFTSRDAANFLRAFDSLTECRFEVEEATRRN